MKLDHLLIAHFLLTQNNTSLLQCWIHIQLMSMLTWCHANNTACSQCLFHWLHGHISHNGVPELRTEDKRLLISTNFTQSYFFSSVLHVLSFFFFFLIWFAGKKDGDDGSGDQVDIPKRTTPAKGMHVSFPLKISLLKYKSPHVLFSSLCTALYA